jgi:hypothetical protein
MASKVVQSSPRRHRRRRYCRCTPAGPACSSAHCVSAVTSTSIDISPSLSSSGSESSLVLKRKALLSRARRLRMRERSVSGPCQPMLGSRLPSSRLALQYGLVASNRLRRLSLLTAARCCPIPSICDSSGDGADERRERASTSSRFGARACVCAVVGVAVAPASVLGVVIAGVGGVASGASVVA